MQIDLKDLWWFNHRIVHSYTSCNRLCFRHDPNIQMIVTQIPPSRLPKTIIQRNHASLQEASKGTRDVMTHSKIVRKTFRHFLDLPFMITDLWLVKSCDANSYIILKALLDYLSSNQLYLRYYRVIRSTQTSLKCVDWIGVDRTGNFYSAKDQRPNWQEGCKNQLTTLNSRYFSIKNVP